MASALSIIWGKIIHDLTLYEREIRPGEISYEQFRPGAEPREVREERLHSEPAGTVESQDLAPSL